MMEENDSEKKVVRILVGIIILLVIVLGSIIFTQDSEKTYSQSTEIENVGTDIQYEDFIRQHNPDEISVVPTMLDEVYDNSTWCGTFQLVWNDMCNELVGDDIKFEQTISSVDNLNKQAFTEKDISEEYYYKKFGLKTTKLKTEIETGIKSKFNEKSEILNNISWLKEDLNDDKNENLNKYLFYSMLKRTFKFQNKFDILENGKFGNDYEDVKYFGINNESVIALRKQIEVLYYNSDTDFAIVINSEDKDQIVLVRNPQGRSFENIYSNINKKAEEYKGSRAFLDQDILKIPNLDINVIKAYEGIKGKEFTAKDGSIGVIEDALQTINFNLDNTGGAVKSEGLAGMTLSATLEEKEQRKFNFDGNFAIFLKEETKEKPYFAANVTNINLFQKK